VKIRFHIHYHTSWGQRLFVVGSLPQLGEWHATNAASMTYTADGTWFLELETPRNQPPEFTYKYVICHEPSGGREWEAGEDRTFGCDPKRFAGVEIHDTWRPSGIPENALLTSAFTNVVFRRAGEASSSVPRVRSSGQVHRFRIRAPRVGPGHRVGLVGSDPALGGWDEDKVVAMTSDAFPVWEADVSLTGTPGDLVFYKYAICDADGRVITWDQGADRAIHLHDGPRRKKLTVLNDELFRYPVGSWKGAGVSIPVFSLRTRNGLGVGEFPDIKILVDWAKRTGLKMIQVLPVNDTVATHTWVDSYPYAAISVFALHPMYMNIEAMDVPEIMVSLDAVREEKATLNAQEEVDYESVMFIKSWYFKQAYDAVKGRILNDPDFTAFFEQNRTWLVPYAVFSCLRDRYGTSDHTAWPDYNCPTEDDIERFAATDTPHYDDVAVHYFIQYHLHKQLAGAAEYARANGIVLKGDIPIGVYRHSTDTWLYPDLFNMDAQAGAPPDAFAIDGQNWGFPTYRWESMARDGYGWWSNRLHQMSEYFDAFRIDHILGFFRIWEIPGNQVQGIMGHFSPALPMSPAEIEAWGLRFDPRRLAEPYIRRHMLDSMFGERADEVISEYLDEYEPGCFRFKPGFEGQKDIMEHLASPDGTPPTPDDPDAALMWQLFELMSEVLFLRDPQGGEDLFHPRSTFHRTHSYRELDWYTKQRLGELYIEYFYRRHEEFWREQAMVRLPAIRGATTMLICGEDLGMVPDCVPSVLRDLEILSLDVQRMPKDPKREFHHPDDSPYLSVCTTSSHDMPGLREWWEEDRGRSQRFFNTILGQYGTAPYFCEPWVCRDVLAQHLHSPAMWAVFPIQDLLAISGELRREDAEAERINIPSNPQHYWRYRLHVDLEDLLESDDFNDDLKDLIDAAGRNSEY